MEFGCKMFNEKFINWLESWFGVAEKNISKSDISIIKGHLEHFSNESINRDDLKNGPESYFDKSGQPIYYVKPHQ